jgi:hypothetical protein
MYKIKDCFPNVELVFCIYLVIMKENSSSERRLSKTYKNRSRTSLGREKLKQVERKCKI